MNRIELHQVTKDYLLWDRKQRVKQALLDLSNWRTPFRGFHRVRVLDQVDLTVGAGEAVAILGANGAGKSTLLKVLAGIVAPTQGQVQLRGRCIPLLSLGSGFQRQLTGEENLRLYASVLGVEPRTLEERWTDIWAFSELGPALHRPLRTYSTGMAHRLAFSLAIHLDADVLLVDEVFATGDLRFRTKCIEALQGRLQAGATLLLVTHSLSEVPELCDRAVILEKGKIAFDGPVNSALDLHRHQMAQPAHP